VREELDLASWYWRTELGKSITEFGDDAGDSGIEGPKSTEGVLKMRNERQRAMEVDARQQSDGWQTWERLGHNSGKKRVSIVKRGLRTRVWIQMWVIPYNYYDMGHYYTRGPANILAPSKSTNRRSRPKRPDPDVTIVGARNDLSHKSWHSGPHINRSRLAYLVISERK
jgi:hypothetical protein